MLSAVLLGLAATLAGQPAAEMEAPAPREVAIVRPVSIDPQELYATPILDALAATSRGLTADMVAQAAVETSPQVSIQRAELRRTAASVDSTLARFVPSLMGAATYSRISRANIAFGSGTGAILGAVNEGPVRVAPCANNPAASCVVDAQGVPVGAAGFGSISVPLNNYSLTASLSLPFLDYALKLMPARRGSQAQTEAVVYQRDAEKLAAELNARLIYYDWLRAKAQVAVAQEMLRSAQARLGDAETSFAVGAVTQVDVLRFDALAADAEASLVAATSFEQLAQRQLAIVMGIEPRAFDVGEDIFNLAVRPTEESSDGLIEEAYAHRLELKAFQRAYVAQEQAKRATLGDAIPHLDGFADATLANPNQRFFPLESRWRGNWALGLTLSWRLADFLNGRSQAKQAKADQRSISANAEAMRRAVALEVESSRAEAHRARATIALGARSLRSALAAYDQQVALYQAGEVTATDVIEAQVQRMNASLRDLNARIDLKVSELKLERALGRREPLAISGDAEDRAYEQVGRRRAR